MQLIATSERSWQGAERNGTVDPGGLTRSQQVIPGWLLSPVRCVVAADARAQTMALGALWSTGDKDSQGEGKQWGEKAGGKSRFECLSKSV